MENLSRLETTISRIVNECQEETVEKFIKLLNSKLGNRQTSKYEWSRIMMPNYIPASLLADFTYAWGNSSLTSEALLFGLCTAFKSKRQLTAKAPNIELVWTGPFPPSTGNIRSTLAVMQEMLANAKRRVLLVGYSLTASTPFPVAVIDQLKHAMFRGCEIRIALHDEGNNYRNLKQVWPSSWPLPTLLRWVGEPEDDMASLHAKLLLVDENDLLVTSANLTHHGLSSNIEVGIRVKGNDVAKQMAIHFTSLERSGILQRVN